MIAHLLLHLLGVDNVSGPWYAFWSGFGGDLELFGVVAVYFRRHNCHVRHCYRFGHHPVAGEGVFCNKHYGGV